MEKKLIVLFLFVRNQWLPGQLPEDPKLATTSLRFLYKLAKDELCTQTTLWRKQKKIILGKLLALESISMVVFAFMFSFALFLQQVLKEGFQ